MGGRRRLAGQKVSFTERGGAIATPLGKARGKGGEVKLQGAILLTATVLLSAPSAFAAFPGENGKIAFTSTRDGFGQIYVMNADGTNQVRLTTPLAARDPAWSSDGQKIAYNTGTGGTMAVMNADGTGQVTLAPGGQDPAWSPDGLKLAFTSFRDADGEIYVMDADGTNLTRLTNSPLQDLEPAWSPDGQKIAFTSKRDGGAPEIYVMNADGSGQLRLTNVDDSNEEPTWSPDGQKIAFTRPRFGVGDPEVFVMNADGSNQTSLTANSPDDDNTPAWSPDGQKIAFASGRDQEDREIYLMNPDGSGQTAVTNNANGANDFAPDWQPAPGADRDGDALLDSWETEGLDIDGDDVVDLDLPALGADPDHKDVFVEVDYMAGHRFDQAQIDAVVAAFAAAPVPNLDGQAGIALHVDNGPASVMDPRTGELWGTLSDQESLTHQDILGSDFVTAGVRRYDFSEFESIRQTRFAAVRRPVFHYAIAAHSGPAQRFSGIARDIPAADFIVTLHENCSPLAPTLAGECVPDPEYTAATFMHELGHTLGLHHGGTDDFNRKPNYLSVMNYNFGFGLAIADGSFELDYSRFEVPLDETALDEQRGFGVDAGALTAFNTIYRCPDGTKKTIGLATQVVDWNCSGFISAFPLAADANGDGTETQLTGPIDWSRIVYDGGGIGALNEPPPPDSVAIDEPTPAETIANQQLLEAGRSPQPDLPPPSLPQPDPPAAAPDTIAPETKIDGSPKKKLSKARTKISFSADEAGSTFECKLDKKEFKRCVSPAKLKRLKAGKHSFEVRAIDAAGNVDATPAKHRFRVSRDDS